MIDETIEELKKVKQILDELQEQYNYAVEQLVIYEKALELACEDLSNARCMLCKCGKNDLTGVLENSPDYFKQKAEFDK